MRGTTGGLELGLGGGGDVGGNPRYTDKNQKEWDNGNNGTHGALRHDAKNTTDADRGLFVPTRKQHRPQGAVISVETAANKAALRRWGEARRRR